MKTPLESLLSRYTLTSIDESWQALREITQEIALLGLWRGKFFEHAAFYGGTALRIAHGLPRFSEDMDFSLLAPNPHFRLQAYFTHLEQELRAFGFEVTIEQKEKSAESPIDSAFVKMNTRSGLLALQIPQSIVGRIAREQLLKIRFEIDTDPPPGAAYETRFLYTPQPYSVRLYDLASLFAGKLHAALARQWKGRVKGRDWFDMIWFVGRQTPASLGHLHARLVQTGHVSAQQLFTEHTAKALLRERVTALDIDAARRDVEPFLRDRGQIALWSREFFLDAVERIVFS